MDTMRICPGCKLPLPANAPQGLCPECLVKAGLGTGVEIGPESLGQPGDATRFVPPALEELARFFPQLEIIRLLGRGGMGAVYQARQRQLDRVVALKILPPTVSQAPSFAEQFAREARALAKLTHQHIVTLYEFGQVDGLFYFLMEFVDGMSLRQLLDRRRLAPAEALAIVPQICEALQYAHDRGIVHRDIKPENILLNCEGQVKIADFGVAKIIAVESPTSGTAGTNPATPPFTQTGRVVGTPQYMAPEQVDHPLQVDHRADIYSLGVVFYQMLTGELPAGKFQPPSRKVEVDVRLDEVVLHALAREPERRYQQARQVQSDVETIARTSTREEGIPAVTARIPTIPTWATVLLGAAAVVIMGAVLLAIVRYRHSLVAEQPVQRQAMSEKELQQGVEVTVGLLGSYNQRLLDLDQGLTLRPPDAPTFALWSAERRREFLRANGVDLMITGNGRTTWGLATPVGNDIKLKRVPLDSWTSASLPDISHITFEQLTPLRFPDSGLDLLWLPLPTHPTNAENNFAFQTANGACGLLRIKEVELNPAKPASVKVAFRKLPVTGWMSADKRAPEEDDVAGVPAREMRASGDPNQRFFLIGLNPTNPVPPRGYSLLIVLPGGDGGPGFLNFVKRIYQHALTENYLIAELIAPRWDARQAETLVWPTEGTPYPAMKFSTEAFVEAVVNEIERENKLDARHIFTLTWSSSGNAGYAVSLYPNTRVTGSFVAMAPFRPGGLARLNAARGRSYFLLHSPEDSMIPVAMAYQARDTLSSFEAGVMLKTYEGGHGWRGDVYGLINEGIRWLENQANRIATPRLFQNLNGPDENEILNQNL